MDISHFIFSFISRWTFELLPLLAIMNYATMNIHVQVFVWMYVFISLGYILRMELQDHMITLFNNLRNCQTAIKNCYPKRLYHFMFP